ncbi:zinc-finger domain-containing protein [Bacillus sp. V3-13]|uniref:zinc-finger domain-containing protein n=1 Tax=Bacillus sp. V3-13 TaxID=2053728 RepID=UPI000C77A7CD|nr:zinc-finger domain-containing protein [Bacillus sp. V3-13]PLR77213.1 zinc-finger domain-containing protein [Bacillus sp. V3-13]
MKRKELLHEMGELMSHYCEGCFLHKHHRKEKGKKYAHRFCITQCTVGEKIKAYGNKLS